MRKNIFVVFVAAQLALAANFVFGAVQNAKTLETFSAAERCEAAFKAKQSIAPRGSMANSRIKFENEKRGRVAFLGGSITEMNGWRNMTQEALQKRFPETKFEFVDAGISSTGSTPGAFRMENDVLSKGEIDLIFIENAVNDDTNEFPPIKQIRGMEGEIRRVLLANPLTDIVVLHFIYDPFIPIEAKGESPEVIKNHEKVCEHYQVSSINLTREIAKRMRDGEFDWKKFGGTHPAPFGHKYYSAAIENLLDLMWNKNCPLAVACQKNNSSINGANGEKNKVQKKFAKAGQSDFGKSKLQKKPHILPEPLDKFSYFRGKFININQAKLKNGWALVENWKPTPPPMKASGGSNADTLYSFDGGAKVAKKVHTRKNFVNVPMLEAREAGAQMSLDFSGTAVGIFCAAGPNAGILEYSIDGAAFKKLDTFTHWSSSLYLPWVYIFDDELSAGRHTITIKMSADKNAKSSGTECQIRNFVVN